MNCVGTKVQEANLVPFTSEDEAAKERARELGRKGGLKRAENARKRKALEARDAEAMSQAMEDLVAQFNREELASNAAAVAQMLLARVAAGDIEISGRDVAGLLDVLVQVVRLEEGLATSHTATVSLGDGAVLERIASLRAEHSRSGGESHELKEATPLPPGGQGGTPGSTPER